MLPLAALPADRSLKMGKGVSPGFAHGLSAARHRDRREASNPLEGLVVGEQELATPQRAVRTEPEPVKRNAENGARIERYCILRQTARDMGVVVLDLLNPASVRHRPLPAEFGREIIGVHIDRDRLGHVIVQRQIKREGFLVVRESGRVLQDRQCAGRGSPARL